MPLATPLCLAVMMVAAAAAASAPCPKGLSYWDMTGQQCNQCTTCAPNEVVLLPCQPYKDTMCGPISGLNINWPWMRSAAQVKAATPSTTRPPKKAVRPAGRKLVTPPLAPPTPAPNSPSTEAPAARPSTEQEAATTEPAATEAAATHQVVWTQSSSEAPTTRVSAQPFLAQDASTLMVEWDWLSLTLTLTIAAFVALLVVFAVYAAVHARRATLRRRRLQQELDAAQLCLFPTSVTSGGEDAELQTLNSPSPKGMYNANQCLYLEKLLNQKQSRRANIYVETGRQATPAPARRSSRWKTKQYPARTP